MAREMTAKLHADWRPTEEQRRKAVAIACWHRWRTDKPSTYAEIRDRATRRRRDRSLILTDMTPAIVAEIRAKTKFCHYCAKPLIPSKVTIDHVIPLSKGGLHQRKNVVGCCRDCNSRKGSKLNWKPDKAPSPAF